MANPGKPTIYNLVLTTAGTEYSQTIPEMSSKVMARARQATDLQVAFTALQSGTIYFTVPAGQTYWDDGVSSSSTFYFQSGANGTVVEILVWSGA